MKSCPVKCKEIRVLHAAPLQWIPGIIKNGFQLVKEYPERASFGKGSAEHDIIFFERENELGIKYALSWMRSLESNREEAGKLGLVRATICTCDYLDKFLLSVLRKRLAFNATKFIMKAKDMPESKMDWAYDHFGTRLLESKYYDDPLSFLRKVANDSDHILKDANGKETGVRWYGIGEVMTYLGFDAADGYTGSHIISSDRDKPINEIVVANTDIIYDIEQVDVGEMCKEYRRDDDIQKLCKAIFGGD